MEKTINIKHEPRWRRSNYSASGNCVEVAWPAPTKTAVRDSKDRNGPTLTFSTPDWQAFLGRLG